MALNLNIVKTFLSRFACFPKCCLFEEIDNNSMCALFNLCVLAFVYMDLSKINE